jgi:hypothetical protein
MAANPGDRFVSHYSRTPLSQVALGVTLAVVISGETAMPGTIAPDISPKHFASVSMVEPLRGLGKGIARQFGLLNAYR